MKPLRQNKSQILTYSVLLLAAVFSMHLIRKCDKATPLPLVTTGNSRGDTVDVAIIYGPMSYYIYTDTLGGLNLDLLHAFAHDTGKNLKFWPVVNLHEAMSRLEKGGYDMLASLPADNSVKNRFLTTRSVFLDRLVLIQAVDSGIHPDVTSALDLANDTVHIHKDSPAGARLTHLSNEIGANIEIAADSDLSEEYLCIKVAKGEIRLAVVNEKTARIMQRTYPRLSFETPVSFTQFQVWALAKSDTALLHCADSWLQTFQSGDEYRKLLERYNQ